MSDYITRMYEQKYQRWIQRMGAWIVKDMHKRAANNPAIKQMLDEGELEAEVVIKWYKRK